MRKACRSKWPMNMRSRVTNEDITERYPHSLSTNTQWEKLTNAMYMMKNATKKEARGAATEPTVCEGIRSNGGYGKKHLSVKPELWVLHIQGDQKNVPPPSRAEMKNPPEKLRIAFSNTTYLNIIWRFSSTTMHYLCLYDSYCKMNHVSIFGVLLKSYFCRLRQNLT